MSGQIHRAGASLACWLVLISAPLSWAGQLAGKHFESTDTWIESRAVKIPVTLVVPSDIKASPFPLVILLHGHGGTRHEAGGYTRVAQGIAKHGIASIRMDFPGCGDSLEGFENNNLANMIADIQSSKAHALRALNIDQSRLGLLGFSMGGRLALTLATTETDYRAIGLWAPDAEAGEANIREYLGGSDRYKQMRATARAQGFAPFTTFWGQDQKLGYQWFTDMEASKPASSIHHYQGALFVLYGDLDTIIRPEISRGVIHKAVNAKPAIEHQVTGADHGLGLFNDDTVRSDEVIQSTIHFFAEHL